MAPQYRAVAGNLGRFQTSVSKLNIARPISKLNIAWPISKLSNLNIARPISKPRPDPGLGWSQFLVKVLRNIEGVPAPLDTLAPAS